MGSRQTQKLFFSHMARVKFFFCFFLFKSKQCFGFLFTLIMGECAIRINVSFAQRFFFCWGKTFPKSLSPTKKKGREPGDLDEKRFFVYLFILFFTTEQFFGMAHFHILHMARIRKKKHRLFLNTFWSKRTWIIQYFKL